MERLQKYIAGCGVTSRRKAEEMILNGDVSVNDVIINQLGYKVNEDTDTVKIKGKVIKPVSNKIYIKLNKPVGYVTTVKDQFDRKCVIDLINIKERVYPVGRLDYDTSGLLLLTNDGELANKMMHPKYKVYKKYIAVVSGAVSDSEIERLRNGVIIEDYKTAPAIVKYIEKNSNSTTLEISIREGKNRQVRKMCESVGHSVIKLKRVSFGDIILDNLKIGEYRELNSSEINYLNSL